MSYSDEERRAIELVTAAVSHGFRVSLDTEIKNSMDVAAIVKELFACDEMTLTIVNGKMRATFNLVYGNGEDGPISDHTDNVVGNYFFQLIMPTLD